MDQDVLGNAVSDVERETYGVYESLKALAARDDAPPCVARNAKKALSCLWQACNDLDLPVEQLYDLGV